MLVAAPSQGRLKLCTQRPAPPWARPPPFHHTQGEIRDRTLLRGRRGLGPPAPWQALEGGGCSACTVRRASLLGGTIHPPPAHLLQGHLLLPATPAGP